MCEDIGLLNAKDVLVDEAALQEYEEGMQFFWMELVHLHTTIFIIEKIVQFPFDVFTGPGERHFFRVVVANFWDIAVLQIHKLANDQGKDPHTLLRFKNRIHDLVKAEYLEEFNERLKAAKFDTNIKRSLQKVELIRHNRIAHMKREFGRSFPTEARMDLVELMRLRDAVTKLLNVLAFNTEYMMLTPEYHPKVRHPRGTDSRPDIERLLDTVARDSNILNMAERNPIRWQHLKPRLPAEDMEQINAYRRKFNMPEI